MAISRNSRQMQTESFVDRFFGSRYDLVLAIIPLSLALAVAIGLVLSVPVHLAAGVASLFCAVCLADAVYFNPPTDVN